MKLVTRPMKQKNKCDMKMKQGPLGKEEGPAQGIKAKKKRETRKKNK